MLKRESTGFTAPNPFGNAFAARALDSSVTIVLHV
jgi:hypothetical protein